MPEAVMAMPRASRLYPPFMGHSDDPWLGDLRRDEFRLDDLPPIDNFLEDVHAIGSDAVDADDQIGSGELVSIDEYLEVVPELDADGWAVSSWQNYDWQGLAALGSIAAYSENAEADAEWSTTDWSPAGTAVRTPEERAAYELAHPTADEVALALDSIARKIRSGELSIDQFRGMPPEAALAAALAAMLKLRR